ncbi:MAG: CDP-diacylglycerol--serine O-phosphatidyltransferase [Sporomusaceae bacterium]|nr:CDP-diacylglycerol--serine O-phosphatidyltransferase [Sporomusaceae bacterium]
MRTFIPNLLTCSNLVFGFLAMVAAFQGDFVASALLVFVAMVADGLDGRAARYFGVSSEFGKELDSLCDAGSFGVAPAFLAYVYMLKDLGWIGALICAAFATCGALRLARFNVMTGVVKGYFLGLPIPAAGCTVALFVMTGLKPPLWMFAIFVAVFAYLMVSTVKYPDFKGKGEKIRPVPAVLAVLVGGYLIYLSPQGALFAAFFAYAVFGLLNNLFALFEAKES